MDNGKRPMRIGIVGWGVEGQSAYHFFGPSHEYLIVNEHPRDDFPRQSGKIKVRYIPKDRQPGLTGNVKDLSYLEGIEDCDKIIYSVTSQPNLKKFFGDDKAFWDKATTVLHVFFENVKSKNIIGVTGNKGKGTTATLIAKLLEAGGQKVYLAGNIGRSVLDFVREIKPGDWVVLELSNFQLKDFPYSPHVAVCLMLMEEHMEWHKDMAGYLDAKSNIFKHQGKEDVAVYYGLDANCKKLAGYSKGKKVPYFKKPGAYVREDGMIVVGKPQIEVITKTEVKLVGEHNLQNICAALTTAYEAIGGLDKARAVLSSFIGLEHRLELVRTFEGVKYYDDSFATTPHSSIVALRAFEEPKIVILGGHDKGLDYSPLSKEIAGSDVRHVIAVGMLADKLAKMLRDKGFTDITLGLVKMPDMVDAARSHARPGDVVLLSTGTSSFGLFKDYKDRGIQFKQAVQALR